MEKKRSPLPRLNWPPLIKGRLVKRYKRFLADVVLENGQSVTAHCPNSGRMTGCCQPGRPVYISDHKAPHRKLRYTWQLIEMPSSLVGVNTQIPNRLVAEAIKASGVPGLKGYQELKREIPVNDGSRLDIMLTAPGRRTCFVEIKNCSLVENGIALFPDAPTARGRKHLQKLEQLHFEGHRAVIFFLVQRMDATRFGPADRIDPLYGQLLRNAVAAGVEILAYDVRITLENISLGKRIECNL